MRLDMFEADFARIAVNRPSLRCVDAQGLGFDLVLKILQRDDPLRRLYVRRRWQGDQASASLSGEMQGCKLERRSFSEIGLSRT